MHDAVTHLTESIAEVQFTQKFITQPLDCFSGAKWSDGLRLASFMRIVCIMFYLQLFWKKKYFLSKNAVFKKCLTKALKNA